MDDRKRQINEAEQRKREQLALLDAALSRIGEAILERTGDSHDGDDPAFADLAAYRRFRGDIAGSQDAIAGAEEQMRRLKELEEGIAARECESGLCARDLSAMYGKLGKLLFEEAAAGGESAGAYEEFCAPFRGQADELASKVQSLEDRLAGLEQREKGNVFAWIGKSAQGLVLRSFLGKAQENLEQLRRSAGERFSRRGSRSLFPETAAIDALRAETERRQEDALTIAQDLALLIDEKRGISDGFAADGGPVRFIQALRNSIAHTQSELRVLFMRIGAEAAGVDALGDEPAERREAVLSLVAPEDREGIEAAARMGRTIRDCDVVVGKLKASLAIDDEKSKIEKCRRQIGEKRDRIAQAERNIAALEEAIRESETAIGNLRQML